MDNLDEREKRAAESILENESLTDGLDDASAQVLLDWGLACAKLIAQSTAGLGEAEAEEVMSTRLKAVRRLMRPMDKWINRQEADPEGHAGLLDKIVEQATLVYGEDYTPPTAAHQAAFLEQYQASNHNPEQTIVDLRQFLENSNSLTRAGGEDGQKVEQEKE